MCISYSSARQRELKIATSELRNSFAPLIECLPGTVRSSCLSISPILQLAFASKSLLSSPA